MGWHVCCKSSRAGIEQTLGWQRQAAHHVRSLTAALPTSYAQQGHTQGHRARLGRSFADRLRTVRVRSLTRPSCTRALCL